MGRRNKVEKLAETEFDFVIRAVTNGRTDREISADFEREFSQKLDKNSINRWRNTVGEELADRYRLARFQAKQLREDLALTDEDDYQTVIKNIEEKLLTATRDVVAKDPIKLLSVRQEEERLRHRRAELELKQKQLEFEKEKFERTQNAQADRFKIGGETWKFILSYFLKNDPTMADGLTKYSATLLEELGEHIEQIQTA